MMKTSRTKSIWAEGFHTTKTFGYWSETGLSVVAAHDGKPRDPRHGWMGRKCGAVFHGPPDVVRLAAAAKTWNVLYPVGLRVVNKFLGERDLERKENLTEFRSI